MHVQIRCKQEAILGDAAGEFAQPQVVPLRYQCTLAVLTNACAVQLAQILVNALAARDASTLASVAVARSAVGASVLRLLYRHYAQAYCALVDAHSITQGKALILLATSHPCKAVRHRWCQQSYIPDIVGDSSAAWRCHAPHVARIDWPADSRFHPRHLHWFAAQRSTFMVQVDIRFTPDPLLQATLVDGLQAIEFERNTAFKAVLSCLDAVASRKG